MDSYFIKLTGKMNVPEPIAIGHNYKLLVDGSVTDERKKDNEDGSYSYTAEFRSITGEIQKDHGKIVKLKDARKYSAKIRAVLYRLWEADSESKQTAEESYESAQKIILGDIDTIYERSKKR